VNELRSGATPQTGAQPDRPTQALIKTVWRWTKVPLSVTLVGISAWVLSGRTDELAGASSYLGHIYWGWVATAIASEILSIVSLALLQQRLLKAGALRLRIGPMTTITLAGTAIQNSLPAGAVVSALYSYHQFRRRGADESLAWWTLVVMAALGQLTLVLLAATGLAMAVGPGNSFDLAEVIIGLLLAGVVVLWAWAKRTWLLSRLAGPLRLVQRLLRRPRGDADQLIAAVVNRVTAFNPSRFDWACAWGAGMANWVFDLACLAMAFLAVHAAIPWRGLLLAYTAGQLAANLPITPGGLGAVEGSITIALVAFGGGTEATVAAVLLYRIISFWGSIPVGGLAWAGLSLSGRARAPQ
jgi:uncharacterized protein (TIRG00374 family)